MDSRQNLTLSKAIASEIKKNVVSFEDLGMYETPFLNSEIIGLNTRLHDLRTMAEEALNALSGYQNFDLTNLRYNRIMIRLSTASYGYGACGEFTDTTIFKSLKAGIRAPVYFIGVENINQKEKNHGLVIIGNCKHLKNARFETPEQLINAITSLSEDHIIVDSFFNTVTIPNDFPERLRTIFKQQGFNHIHECDEMNYMIPDLKKIELQTNYVINMIGKKLHDPTEIIKSDIQDLFTLRQLRYYAGLLGEYKTFTLNCDLDLQQNLIGFFHPYNQQNGKPFPPNQRIMITSFAKSQFSIQSEWLKTNPDKIKELSNKIHVSPDTFAI